MPAVRQETEKAEINMQGSEVNENFSFVIPFFAQIGIFPNAMAGQNPIGLFNILVSSTKAGRFAYAKVVFLAMKQMWFESRKANLPTNILIPKKIIILLLLLLLFFFCAGTLAEL